MFAYEWLDPERVTAGDALQINGLLQQLGDDRHGFIDASEIASIAAESAWLVARDQTKSIVGMGIFTILPPLPAGKTGCVNEVVVDRPLRKRGIGNTIIQLLIERARISVDRLDLTCNPTWASAARLYERHGFRRRDTNCYVLGL